jgi:hypothetical protein
MLLLFGLMYLMKRLGMPRAYSSVTALSIVLVIVYAAGNTSLPNSWANPPQSFEDQLSNYFINIQADSDNGLDLPPSVPNQDSDNSNQSVSDSSGDEVSNEILDNETNNENVDQSLSDSSDQGVTNEILNNDTAADNLNQSISGLSKEEGTNEMSSSNDTETESTNQSMSGLSEEEGTNENINQTTETQQTQNQLQNNTQEVNVNNTVNNQIQINQRLESIISEEEGEKPIPLEEQKKVESGDIIVMREHKTLTGPNCRTGNVLSGASNEGDLKVLAECQEAVGIVKHTKKMDDGDFKFFLDLDEKYKFLVNDKNIQKTDGFLVVEIVPQDQNIENVYLPKTGDQVHIWGSWVTDKPKGWHELHPTWKVLNEIGG